MLGGASCPLESASRFLDEHGPQAEPHRDILFLRREQQKNTLREANLRPSSSMEQESGKRSLFQSKRKKQYWPEDLPPIRDRPHLGVGDAVGLWVFDRHRDLDDFVSESQSFEE